MSARELVQPRARRCVSPSRRSRPQIDRACDDQMPSNECEYVARSSFRLLLRRIAIMAVSDDTHIAGRIAGKMPACRARLEAYLPNTKTLTVRHFVSF